MENNNDIRITDESKAYLKETAAWASFLSIVQFVATGMVFLGGLAVTFTGAAIKYALDMPFNPALIGIVYIIAGALIFFPAYFQMKFASEIKRAILTGDTVTATGAFEYLKSTYKFNGIATIVSIGLVVIVVPIVTISAAIAAM